MKIRTKILLISAIPVFLLSTFSFSEIKEKNIAISNLVELKYYSNILVKSSNLIHELQKERGYSSLFISNDGKRFKSELNLQRKNTDRELSNLKDYLFNSKSFTDQAVLELESNIKEYIFKINNYRSLINNLNKTPEDAINFYSDIIKNISKYSTELVVLNKSPNIELENLKISYLHLFHLKENMGKERAFVSSILSKNKIDKTKTIKLLSLIQNKKIHEDLLNTFLSLEQKNVYQKLIKSPSMLKMLEVEKILIEKDKDFNSTF